MLSHLSSWVPSSIVYEAGFVEWPPVRRSGDCQLI